MVMKPLGDVVTDVVARLSPTDWTHERPGGNFCPSCGHGLGDDKACTWCGWPDPEAMRKRTAETLAKAAPAIAAAKEIAPPACRVPDPDKMHAVLQKARDWLADDLQSLVRSVCIHDDEPNLETMDPEDRKAVEELRGIVAEIDAALKT
jgi:hypothetical protein